MEGVVPKIPLGPDFCVIFLAYVSLPKVYSFYVDRMALVLLPVFLKNLYVIMGAPVSKNGPMLYHTYVENGDR
jgi:hypothetical protein